MLCNYRYCNKEITYGRTDRRFCNKNCKIKETAIVKEIKHLNIRSKRGKDFILRSKVRHNNKYNYDLVIYKNARTKVNIVCPTHGIFNQTPDAHLYAGSGCESCSRDLHKLTTLNEDRLLNINNIHKYYYQYNDMSIVNGYINICCPVHGTFSQIIYFHENGHGCSLCNSTSRGEKKIKNYLENKNIVFNMNHTFEDCKNKKRLKFDFYLQNNNIIIEYDGEHHFKENKYFGIGNLEYITNNDNIKNKYCEDNNIEIIRIPYWDYNNIDDILDIRFYNFF
jgi:very-short-patch-repair endonuclease